MSDGGCDVSQGCQNVIEDWQKLLQVRSLVFAPHDDLRTWLKYASLCRRNGRLVCHLTIRSASVGSDLIPGFPRILEVMEFKKGIFQAWKVMENYCGPESHGKVMEFHQ